MKPGIRDPVAAHFPRFALVAEMRHSSWIHDEALGTLVDHGIGFCNIDQAEYTKATPPTAFLTSVSATSGSTGAIRRTGSRN